MHPPWSWSLLGACVSNLWTSQSHCPSMLPVLEMKSKLTFLEIVTQKKRKKGPKGFVADNCLSMSVYGAAVATEETGVIVRKERGYIAVVSGTCADTTGALCPATVSTL